MADQFENRKQIVNLELGPNACDFRKLSEVALSSAITECVTNDKYRKNAIEIAKRIQGTDGLQLTVQLLEDIRITSYNVCYTKLLRIHHPIFSKSHFPLNISIKVETE